MSSSSRSARMTSKAPRRLKRTFRRPSTSCPPLWVVAQGDAGAFFVAKDCSGTSAVSPRVASPRERYKALLSANGYDVDDAILSVIAKSSALSS
jgi:hypothetical protein